MLITIRAAAIIFIIVELKQSTNQLAVCIG